MSAKSLIGLTLLSFALAGGVPSYAAEEVTVHQVYLAAEAGKFDQAQALMDQVLREHPNSGKAHFVEAELLAKQGKLAQAQAELATAERLAPGLPFATPAAVQHIRAQIAASHGAARGGDLAPAPRTLPAPANPGMPWGWVLAGLALAGLIIFAMVRMRRRPAAMPGYGPGAGPQPYGGAPQAGPGAGGGIGSGIMGGLATGAAMGAGLVAGEALMHRFTDGNRPNAGNEPQPQPLREQPPAPDDMGGNDFGLSDNSLWDDGGGAGDAGDEWT
jgi:hypothetical protein